MLNVLITDAHNRLSVYQLKIEEHRNAILTKTNTTDAQSLDDTIKYITKKYQSKRHEELQRKLTSSRSYQRNHNNTDAWVKNISRKQLTECQTQGHSIKHGLDPKLDPKLDSNLDSNLDSKFDLKIY